MKLSFRVVVVSTIVALTLILGGQIYWLTGLYDSIKQDTYTVIMSSIEKADLKEVILRGKIMQKKMGQRSINMGFNYGYKEFMSQPNMIMKNIYGGLHEALDYHWPINFKFIRWYMLAEGRQKNLNYEVYRIVFDWRGATPLIHQFQISKQLPTDMECFTYYNEEAKYSYKVFTTPMFRIVLYRMSGILATTSLIIILLGFAFWYLIHVIMKQRTLEEMKDDFTNNMTHELKTPVAVAYSAVDTLLNFKQGEDKMKRERYLGICLDQLSKLSELIEQILSMSMERRRTLVMKKASIKVGDLLQKLVEYHQLKSEKEVAFDVKISPEDMTIWADAIHINNVVSNLIDNAIKYSGDKPKIRIYADEEVSWSRIVVRDSGIGISKDNQSRIFDKFYRVPTGDRQDVRGYGLGLYYVKQIVEKHGGSVSVESSLGQGTTFTILLPKTR